MMDAALQLSTGIACAIIVFRTEPALNHMHGRTDLFVRISFWQMATAATIELLSILIYGYIPGWREALLSGGLAALLLCERRIRLLTRRPYRKAEP